MSILPIKNVVYGKHNVYVDVTQTILSLFEKGNKTILVENKIFGRDPLRNVKKELIITLPDNSKLVFQERTKVNLEDIFNKISNISTVPTVDSKETVSELDFLPEENNIPAIIDQSKKPVGKLDIPPEKNTDMLLSTLNHDSFVQNVVFIDTYANNTPSHWYMFITDIYKNVLKTHGYNIINKQMTKSYPLIDVSLLDELSNSKSHKNIYVMTPLDFAMFVNKRNSAHKEKIYSFLMDLNYVMIWQEILWEDQIIVGYDYVDPNFIKFFFGHSLLNLVSNLSSIRALEIHGIKHNLYTPIVGYSPINCLVPFEKTDTIHSIDVLIYGTLTPNYIYRNQICGQLSQYSDGQFKMEIITNTFGEELDLFLKKTKIVVHIPSFENLHQIPWAKIVYLQTRKIFFIIEDNNDLHERKLDDMIVTFNRNDAHDLYNKILYYLHNPSERERIINANFEWIKNNYDIDTQIPQIFKNLLKTDYAFLDIPYQKCTSHIFYAQLTDKIKNIIPYNGGTYRLVKTLKELIPDKTKTILIIDVCMLYYLLASRQSELEDLFKIKYYLIVGENFDQKSNTLLGWDPKLHNFTKDNILRKCIENSNMVTVQNSKTFRLFETFGIKNIVYFPIDGYSEDYIIESKYLNKDIDVYYYGWMSERRFNVLKSIPHNISTLVTNLTFNNDDLIDRSKIILHTNSIDNCYHIPFAKLMKLLSNNKIVLIEETEELLTSDLINYVYPFKMTSPNACVKAIEYILSHYEIIQKEVDEKNPREFIKKNYNFANNVKKLLNL